MYGRSTKDMRISKAYLLSHLDTDSSAVLIEDYVDEYLKKKHSDKAWVNYAFDLDASEKDYKYGLEMCRKVQGEVIRTLNRTHDVSAINDYIDESVKIVG